MYRTLDFLHKSAHRAKQNSCCGVHLVTTSLSLGKSHENVSQSYFSHIKKIRNYIFPKKIRRIFCTVKICDIIFITFKHISLEILITLNDDSHYCNMVCSFCMFSILKQSIHYFRNIFYIKSTHLLIVTVDHKTSHKGTFLKLRFIHHLKAK